MVDLGANAISRRASSQGQHLSRMAQVAAGVFVVGTFTWRGRAAEALRSAPLDGAAVFRLCADLLAIGVVLLALSQRQQQAVKGPPASPIQLYFGYIFFALVSGFAAVNAPLVVFRVFDLMTCWLVAFAVVRWCTFPEILQFMRRVLKCLAVLLLISVILWPERALLPARGGLYPYFLNGVFPVLTINTVGTIGLMFFALYLGSPKGGKLGPVLGILLVIAAQYRTGYIALAAIIATFLLVRKGATTKFGLLLAIPAALVLAKSAIFTDAWVRGESAQRSVETLSGRTEYWSSALEVAQRSPIIGTGLSSGTRFEVLDAIGHGATSTIHNTWIEAYVGTGILGLLVLVFVWLQACRICIRFKHLSQAPLLLLVAITVRSITGTSIELPSYMLLFFLISTAGLLKCSRETVSDSGPINVR
jgi:O-antigen ligase